MSDVKDIIIELFGEYSIEEGAYLLTFSNTVNETKEL
jgi:hypothetical protein